MAQSGSILMSGVLMSGVRVDLRDFDLRGGLSSSLEYILAAFRGDDEGRRSVNGVRRQMGVRPDAKNRAGYQREEGMDKFVKARSR